MEEKLQTILTEARNSESLINTLPALDQLRQALWF